MHFFYLEPHSNSFALQLGGSRELGGGEMALVPYVETRDGAAEIPQASGHLLLCKPRYRSVRTGSNWESQRWFGTVSDRRTSLKISAIDDKRCSYFERVNSFVGL